MMEIQTRTAANNFMRQLKQYAFDICPPMRNGAVCETEISREFVFTPEAFGPKDEDLALYYRTVLGFAACRSLIHDQKPRYDFTIYANVEHTFEDYEKLQPFTDMEPEDIDIIKDAITDDEATEQQSVVYSLNTLDVRNIDTSYSYQIMAYGEIVYDSDEHTPLKSLDYDEENECFVLNIDSEDYEILHEKLDNDVDRIINDAQFYDVMGAIKDSQLPQIVSYASAANSMLAILRQIKTGEVY